MNYAVNKVLERDQKGRPIPKEIINDELNCEFSDLTITALPEVHEKPETKSAVEIKNALIHPLSKDSPDNLQITENIIKNQLMNGNGCENQLSYGITNKNIPMNGNSNGNQLMTDSHKTANGWSEDHLATGDRVRNDADFFIGFSTTPGMKHSLILPKGFYKIAAVGGTIILQHLFLWLCQPQHLILNQCCLHRFFVK